MKVFNFNKISGFYNDHVRYRIALMLFLITSLNFADRSILSIAGSDIAKEFSIDPLVMGNIFSAFGWAYVIGQIPGGMLIDKFGVKRVYSIVIILWSLLTLSHGFLWLADVNWAVTLLITLRFLIGLVAAPIFPANAQIVAEWFPFKERGIATSAYTSAQYFSAVIFAPIIGWVTYSYGWKYVFVLFGIIGIICAKNWLKNYNPPNEHKRISIKELEFIQRGGAQYKVSKESLDRKIEKNKSNYPIFQLLRNRTIVGIYVAQYCSTTINYFFITWFPVYLIEEKNMSVLQVGFVSVFPALCAFIGSLLGGIFSDFLLKKGYSLTLARKVPIILGMLISMIIISANYMNSIIAVMIIMSLAFFGKGFGGLGWLIISETSPKKFAGISGALFNTFGNVAGITTPLAIGYILQISSSFNLALLFIGANALIAIFCHLFIVGEIKEYAVQ